MAMDVPAIIARIEDRLVSMGMSKAEFCEASGISSATFSQWRTGQYIPSIRKLKSASSTLNIPYDYLVFGKAIPQGKTPKPKSGVKSIHIMARDMSDIDVDEAERIQNLLDAAFNKRFVVREETNEENS